MKQLIAYLAVVALTLLAGQAVAAPVLITQQPVVLENQNGVYYYPTGVEPATDTDYYYYTVGDTNRVCYLTQQPALASLNPTPLSVNVGGQIQQLNCYETNPNYFTVQPNL